MFSNVKWWSWSTTICNVNFIHKIQIWFFNPNFCFALVSGSKLQCVVCVCVCVCVFFCSTFHLETFDLQITILNFIFMCVKCFEALWWGRGATILTFVHIINISFSCHVITKFALEVFSNLWFFLIQGF